MSQTKAFLISGKGITFLAILLALMLGLILGPIISDRAFSFQEHRPVANLTISDSETGAPVPPVSLSEGFRAVAKDFRPFVVNISSRTLPRTRKGRADQRDQQLNDLFERFFGRRGNPQQGEAISLGSGTIVHEKGYILTNYHVVAPTTDGRGTRVVADRIDVTLSSGDQYGAKVVGWDRASDLAVLKIDAKKSLPSATVGDTTRMQIGDWVMAIGSPFGLEQSVTAGIVSAKARHGDRFARVGNLFGDYLQTDAAINPGNSGGPLVNMRGELVGINTFITSNGGGSLGIGFAIPSNVFVNAYKQLVTQGKIERGWLGVSMNVRPFTREMADHFGVAGDDPTGVLDGDGVLITQLVNEDQRMGNEGPAARAGIRSEDVVVLIGDREIESAFDLRSAIASTPPGEEVPITVVRKGKVLKFNVTLEKRTVEERLRADGRTRSFEDEPAEEERPKEIGLRFEDLTPAQAAQFGVEKEEGGVLIVDVTVGSLADDAGLAPGYIITHANGKPMTNADVFADTVTRLSSGDGVVVRTIIPSPRPPNSIIYTSFVKP